MVSHATKINRLELGAQWLDASDAARAIGVNPKQLTTVIRPLITHQSRSMAGKGARYVGYAYAVHDVERIAAIMAALGCYALEAAKVLWAIRRLGHLGLLAMIEKQLNLLEDKPRRRSSPTHKRARL